MALLAVCHVICHFDHRRLGNTPGKTLSLRFQNRLVPTISALAIKLGPNCLSFLLSLVLSLEAEDGLKIPIKGYHAYQ